MDTRDRVSFADLKNASPSERRRLIAYIADKANEPVNGRLDEIQADISRFERTYKMDSGVLLDALYHGKIRETDEILPWLRLIRLRELLESKS